MENNISLEDMIAALGGVPTDDTPPDDADNPADPPPADDGGNPPADSGTEPPADQGGDEPQQQEPNVDTKAQQAFIHMRQQNKRYSSMIKGIASLVGIEGAETDEEKLLAALQDKITANEAERNKVPVELYQRLQQLEHRDAEYTALQRQQEVAAGFEAVKGKFGLTQDELNSFAEELVRTGKNPLDGGVNLVDAYRTMHFDDLVTKAVAKAVAEEQARAAKAGSQSSTPGSTTGGASDTSEKQVNSVRELEQWLSAQR